MARAKILSSDVEIRAAIKEADRIQSHLVLDRIQYHPRLDVFVLTMQDEQRHVIPREKIQGLGNATAKQLSKVEILGPGSGVYWPALDASFGVAGLIKGIYGTKKWQSDLSRFGAVTASSNKPSPAKKLKEYRERGFKNKPVELLSP